MNQLNTTLSQLHSGCLLGFIAHAIKGWIDLEKSQGWEDRYTYGLNDCAGASGIIRYSEGSCVGIVLDLHSDRFADEQVNPDFYTTGAPEWVQSTALKIAPRWSWDWDAAEVVTFPAITLAFWGDSSGVFSRDTMDEFLENGGHVFSNHMAPSAIASAAFKEEYELSTSQSQLFDIIFKRKCVQKAAEIILSCDEVALLESSSAASEAATRRCLAQIGVTWE